MKKRLKILVTGGNGFIGTNFIANQLTTTENKIINFDCLTYAGQNDNLKDFIKNDNYNFFNGDIRKNNDINTALTKFLPTVIVNFAAETHVDRSIDKPAVFVDTNIIGTFNLLSVSQEYFKSNPNFKFIHISTDEVFGSLDINDPPFSENHSFRPNSPYSASKASSDHLVRAWNKTYKLPTLISNCSNNYGPFQFPEKLIPLIIANCLDEKELPIYGKGENIRDWLYVDDHCKAINTLIDYDNFGETFNIGGNNEVRNIDIVLKICTILDDVRPRKNDLKYENLITFVKDRPGHDIRYAINASKIKRETGWVPEESFDSGIIKTIKWYLENESWWRRIQKKSYNQERLGL